MDCTVSVSGVSANVQSCIVKRDISWLCACVCLCFCMSAKSHTWTMSHNSLVHVIFCALQLLQCMCGSICAHIEPCVMNDMCDMCCLSGMPGTSGLLSIGPAPIEMAYQWRYIWKNSLPTQSLLPPPVRKREINPYHVALVFLSILFLPPSPLLPLSISVSSWRYANRCVSISCQIITIY